MTKKRCYPEINISSQTRAFLEGLFDRAVFSKGYKYLLARLFEKIDLYGYDENECLNQFGKRAQAAYDEVLRYNDDSEEKRKKEILWKIHSKKKSRT